MNHLKLFESFSEIDAICKEHRIYNYTINSEGLVDVESVNLDDLDITKLPLKFGRITGHFSCSRNKLISLVGSPREVGGFFDCNDNQLTSLEGAPQSVGGFFDCSLNRLTSLAGAPDVGGNFYCYSNKLTSLEGGPQEVGGSFDCRDNQITSLDGSPHEIRGAFYCHGNPIDSIYRLFKSYEDFLSSMDYNYLRGTNIIKSRFEEMCLEYGIKVPKIIEGHNYI